MMIKPVSNYSVIASLALDSGVCTTLGELLVVLAMHLCRPTQPDIDEMRRVFVEYEQRRSAAVIRSDN